MEFWFWFPTVLGQGGRDRSPFSSYLCSSRVRISAQKILKLSKKKKLFTKKIQSYLKENFKVRYLKVQSSWETTNYNYFANVDLGLLFTPFNLSSMQKSS